MEQYLHTRFTYWEGAAILIVIVFSVIGIILGIVSATKIFNYWYWRNKRREKWNRVNADFRNAINVIPSMSHHTDYTRQLYISLTQYLIDEGKEVYLHLGFEELKKAMLNKLTVLEILAKERVKEDIQTELTRQYNEQIKSRNRESSYQPQD